MINSYDETQRTGETVTKYIRSIVYEGEYGDWCPICNGEGYLPEGKGVAPVYSNTRCTECHGRGMVYISDPLILVDEKRRWHVVDEEKYAEGVYEMLDQQLDVPYDVLQYLVEKKLLAAMSINVALYLKEREAEQAHVDAKQGDE